MECHNQHPKQNSRTLTRKHHMFETQSSMICQKILLTRSLDHLACPHQTEFLTPKEKGLLNIQVFGPIDRLDAFSLWSLPSLSCQACQNRLGTPWVCSWYAYIPYQRILRAIYLRSFYRLTSREDRMEPW